MKYFLSAIILFLELSLSAQQWCPPGAQWYHNYNDLFGNVGYIETHYAGDTVIVDSVCQKLAVTKHTYSLINGTVNSEGPGEFYTTGSSGVVYLWTGSLFDTLIAYSAVPGDQWDVTLPDGNVSDIMINVTDTGHMTIDDQWLRYLVVQPSDSGENIFMADTIVERIGPIVYMYLNLYSSFFLHYAPGNLRCYSDDEMSYSRVDEPCEIALDVRTTDPDDQIEIYPNPASNEICCTWPDDERPIMVLLMDDTGRSIDTLRSDRSNCFPLPPALNGYYFVQMIFKDRVVQRPVIVEN